MLSSRDLRPGETLGRYEILMPVATGGMATVWAARMVGSRGFQKVVAIKTMLPDLTDDPDFEAMFLDEARLASRIRHPHVAEIIDLGDVDGYVYIVMEWVNGETLFVLNKQARHKGGTPVPILLRIVSNACAGLHAAHELRDETGKPLDLVHRDISPQNIMVSFDGIVKIVDFGVAKAAGRMHETRVAGIMKGKVPYLSPEQLKGLKVDRRSDIFSLGIIMYVMVTGRHPFRGANDLATMDNICMRAPVPLSELVPGIRPDVEAVVMRALEKSPDDRFADCAEMQRALDTAASAVGGSVTDGDVAAFLRSMLGEVIEQRNDQLSQAIKSADTRASAKPPGPPSGRARGSLPSSSQGNIPVSLEGILPVRLDDPPSSRPSSRGAALAVRSRADVAVPTFRPTGRRRGSAAPYVALGVVAVLCASALLLRAGLFPAWIENRAPIWLQPVPAPAPAPAPNTPVPPPAPAKEPARPP